ncbi:peptidase domain-containing ABC transporter [Rothia nasimurium]|uniref:Peptidase domain-containing ABC transporter n=1 Tax=Luteibacter anthropi TaxID=564369 RepID=A0A7X5UAS0_9GAMM|nr:peptidase domain-containing ABC transporter [Luteibacter anthropi]NII06940.1 peptidase domain-containing ABC transporter [Luteibacter anthropi]
MQYAYRDDGSEFEGGGHDEAPATLFFGWKRRVPVLRQTEAAECGLASLAMIAGYYGHRTVLSDLRKIYPVSTKGMTLADVVQCAELLGLASRPVKLEMTEVSSLSTPCILHWNITHYVVLERVTKGYLHIIDPAMGPRRIRIDEASDHFTGIAVEFTTAASFERKDAPPPLSMRKLAGKITGLKRSIATLFGLAMVLEVFTLIAPQYLQMTVDQVLADKDRDLLVFLGLTFLAVLFAQTVVSAVRTWALMWVGSQFVFNWTGNVFRHLLRLPQPYFLSRHIGDISSRFAAITTIQQTLTTQLVAGVLDGAMALMTLMVIMAYSWLMASLTLLAVVLYGVARLLYFRSLKEANLSQITMDARRQSRFIEAVRCAQTIRLANQQSVSTARYLNATADVLNTQISVQKLSLVFDAINSSTAGLQRIAMLWIGGWLGMKGKLSAGMLVAFVAYADQFVTRSMSLIDYLIQLRLLRLQGERLADIVMTEPERHLQGSYLGEIEDSSIRMEGVSFRYGAGERWVIHNCSFHIKSSESVAIVGPSGCGKSTLLRVITGLIDPYSGAVFVGGADLRKIGKSRFRSLCGIVMQDDHALTGTIADNISMFDPSSTIEKIEDAARLAQLHNDIIAMPMGYNSLVGSMGSALSGGQLQRMLLARALYRKPKFLLLDESSSHLDVATEALINAAISELKITRVIIAHRPETIRSADRILLFENGQIKEAGATYMDRHDAHKSHIASETLTNSGDSTRVS